MKIRKACIMVTALVCLLHITACGKPNAETDGQQGQAEKINQTQQTGSGYEIISQEKAHDLMLSESEYLILDVRTIEEYDGEHIPNAVCIPVETIGDEAPAELPDKEQLILVYCRSGNRSKQAAKKLVSLGYTNIKEFGGITTWKYDTVSTDVKQTMDLEENMAKAMLGITVGNKTLYASFADNSSAEAFIELLKEGAVTVDMSDYGNFEKVGDLGVLLPRNDESITTEPGDIILYQGDKITIYYDTNTWNFTRLAKLNATQGEIKQFLGDGNVSVIFSLELGGKE